MAVLDIRNVRIAGVAACVPRRVEENRDYDMLPAEELEQFIADLGVERKHCAVHDGSICASDLCCEAAKRLMSDLEWQPEEVDLLVFVSQTHDYRLPSTAIILQDRLGLPKTTLAFDINQGCCGYLVGLSVVAPLLESGHFKKALLLVGNAQSEYANWNDKPLHCLFGDAGTATALAYSPESAGTLEVATMVDGSRWDALVVPDGASRHPVSASSFDLYDDENNNRRTRLDEKMDGMEVFSAAITFVPRLWRQLKEAQGFENEIIDYCLVHQASRVVIENLSKRLKFPPEKTPSNLRDYGNTSCATIPLLMVTNLAEELRSRHLMLALAAVGVGMTAGVARISTDDIIVSPLLYLE